MDTNKKAQAHAYVEDGPDSVGDRFYNFCWEHFRPQMRVMIEAFVEGKERMAFEDYLAQEEDYDPRER